MKLQPVGISDRFEKKEIVRNDFAGTKTHGFNCIRGCHYGSCSCSCFTGTDCLQSGAQTCVSEYKICHYEDEHCESKHKWQCVVFGNITYCVNR